MTNRRSRCRRAGSLCLLAALVAGCGTEAPTPADPTPNASASASGPVRLTARQLRDLPPEKEAVAALLGVKKLSAGPNDGVSQVLEGVEMSDDLQYYGYSYSTGNPNKGGPFSSAGVLSLVGTEAEVEDLFGELTQDGLEVPREDWEAVDVGATEAQTSFVEVPEESFVIDVTVARLDGLLIFLMVLSDEDHPRLGVSAQVTALVLENARATAAR